MMNAESTEARRHRGGQLGGGGAEHLDVVDAVGPVARLSTACMSAPARAATTMRAWRAMRAVK